MKVVVSFCLINIITIVSAWRELQKPDCDKIDKGQCMNYNYTTAVFTGN